MSNRRDCSRPERWAFDEKLDANAERACREIARRNGFGIERDGDSVFVTDEQRRQKIATGARPWRAAWSYLTHQ